VANVEISITSRYLQEILRLLRGLILLQWAISSRYGSQVTWSFDLARPLHVLTRLRMRGGIPPFHILRVHGTWHLGTGTTVPGSGTSDKSSEFEVILPASGGTLC
jgi:hypothetical protein